MTRLLDTLRTPGAMLVALVLALVAQLEHTAQVFLQVVGAQGVYAQLHAYAFALAVETAVLLFVLAGHRRISYGFALATFATNLSYYAMHDVSLLTLQGAPAVLMSLLLPAAIVGYSHTIADAAPQRATQEKPLERPTTNVEPLKPVQTHLPPIFAPMEAISEAASVEQAGENADLPAMTQKTPATPAPETLPDVAQRSSADIARELGVSRQTVDGWKRRGTLTMNIARRLPTVAAPTTNGNGGTYE